jgi:16S rRNA (guanine527-N7)-methyltransferase
MTSDPPALDFAALAVPLDAGANALGLALNDRQRERLLQYLGLLARWNGTYNLTALRDPAQMLTHHLLDCLAVVAPLRGQRPQGAGRVMDVGSGGGLPGVVLAVMDEQAEVSCVDAVGKKAAFVRQVAAELGLRNLQALHSRVEQVTQRFDIVTSRAFATLAQMCAWTRQSLRDDGVWMAMKGQHPTQEITELPTNVVVFHVEQLKVPGLDAERCLVWLRPPGP